MEGRVGAWKLSRIMKTNIIHSKGVAAEAAAVQQYQIPCAAIKLGLDIHQARYVVVVQEDHATPKPARSFRPEEFVPWSRPCGPGARGLRGL